MLLSQRKHMLRCLRVSICILLIAVTAAFPSTLNAQDDSLQIALKHAANPQQKLGILASLADYYNTRNFDAAIYYAGEGLKLAGDLRDSNAIGRLQSIRGGAWYFKGSYDSAAYYLYHSVQLFERLGNEKELGASLNRLARLYRKTRELDKADLYYDRALKLFESLKDSSNIATIYNESGVVYEYRGDYNEALRRYNLSLQIANKLKDRHAAAYAMNFIAGVYVIQKKYDDAEHYLLQCLHIHQQLNDSFSIALAYGDLGSMYAARKSYEQAYSSYAKSSALAQQLGYPELLASNYRSLADVAAENGNYYDALKYYKDAAAMRDSIFSDERRKQINELNARYETEQKEQLLHIQELAISRRNWIIAGILTGIGLLLLLLYSYYYRSKLKQKSALQDLIMRQQNLATRAVLEAEERERQRIAQDLHDGVGQIMSAAKLNLSAVSNELKEWNEATRLRFENAMGLVDDSCREIRNVSHNMMPNALLKTGLASAIRTFLQKVNTSALIVNLYTEGLDEHLPKETEMMLYRIIQECVNNVIKHAAATKLDISIISDDASISVTIEDNGRGFDLSALKDQSGIGLSNIQSRVNYLKAEIEWDSKPGRGTAVVIHVPL